MHRVMEQISATTILLWSRCDTMLLSNGDTKKDLLINTMNSK